MKSLIYFVGQAFCHQLESRSLFVNNNSLPICARCTGIYLGIFVSLMYLHTNKRWKANKLPKKSICILSIVLILPMIFDGITSYMGLLETNNMIRLITGILTGCNIPILILFVKNFDEEKKTQEIIKNIKELITICSMAIIIGIGIYYNLVPSWYFVSILLIGTYIISIILIFYSFINYVFKNRLNNIVKWFTILVLSSTYIITASWINYSVHLLTL